MYCSKRSILFGFISGLFFGLIQPTYAHLLRVGTIPLDQRHKLVLIGTSSQPENGATTFNFSALGFQGEELAKINPKFLIEMKDGAVVGVRGFELENLDEKDLFYSQTSVNLPPEIIRLASAKSSEQLQATRNVLGFGAQSLGFPIATIATGAKMISDPGKHNKNNLKVQAYYLMEIINQALPPYNRFPELLQAISPDQGVGRKELARVGEALLTRFNPKSTWAGLNVPDHKQGTFYERWRNEQAGIQTKNEGYLIRRTNESQFKVLPFGGNFAIVLWDASPENGSPDSHITLKTDLFDFKALGKSLEKPWETLRELQIDLSQGSVVPWYLVSFVNQKGSVDLVNFAHPGVVGQTIEKTITSDRRWEMAGSFIPLSNWLIQGIRKGIKNKQLRDDDTQYLNRLQSYGSALAIAELRLYEPSMEVRNVSLDMFRQALGPLAIMVPWRTLSFSDLVNTVSYLGMTEELKQAKIHPFLTSKEKESTHRAYFQRLFNFLKKKRDERNEGFDSSEPLKASRGPSRSLASGSAPAQFVPQTPELKPVILLLVDGLRFDRFKQAVEEGLMPNLGALFYSRGTQLESYASRSLTLPSWSTILTGFEPDVHGIRSNTPISRSRQKIAENYLDPTDDILKTKYRHKNRAFRRLEEDLVGEPDKIWMPAYYPKEQSYVNFIPIVSGAHLPVGSLIKDFFRHHASYANDIRFLASALDSASARSTTKAILGDKEGKLKLIVNWYSSVDEACHVNNRLLPNVYAELDQSIGNLLKAAKQHPQLKDATVFLISDHGHTGGFGPFNQNSTIYKAESGATGTIEGPLLNHTDFNLSRFMSGGFSGYSHYRFGVGSVKVPQRHFDLGLMQEFQLPKFKFTPSSLPDASAAIVDYAGNNLAQVYIIDKKDNTTRLNFYQLSNYPNPQKGQKNLNIPGDLLNLTQPGLDVQDRNLVNHIVSQSGKRPVRFFAMALHDPLARASADILAKTPNTAVSNRDPVLVLSRGVGERPYKAALILTRGDFNGRDEFRYIVLKNFSQEPAGQIVAAVSNDPNDDPLGYLGGVIPDARVFSEWKTDREWLKITRSHPTPTAIFALARSLTLSPRYTDPVVGWIPDTIKQDRISEIPDFLVISNFGYAFREDEPLESDHGGLSREEVRNTFAISSLNPERFNQHIELDFPILTRDFTPTILEYAGYGSSVYSPIPKTQGQSWKLEIEQAQLK